MLGYPPMSAAERRPPLAVGSNASLALWAEKKLEEKRMLSAGCKGGQRRALAARPQRITKHAH